MGGSLTDISTVIAHFSLIALPCYKKERVLYCLLIHVEPQVDQEELCLTLIEEFFVVRLRLYNRVSCDRV